MKKMMTRLDFWLQISFQLVESSINLHDELKRSMKREGKRLWWRLSLSLSLFLTSMMMRHRRRRERERENGRESKTVKFLGKKIEGRKKAILLFNGIYIFEVIFIYSFLFLSFYFFSVKYSFNFSLFLFLS